MADEKCRSEIMSNIKCKERERLQESERDNGWVREEASDNWEKYENQQRNNNGNQVEKEEKILINIKTLLLWERSWSASSSVI